MRYRLVLSMLGLLRHHVHPFSQPTAKLDGTWRAMAAERDGKSATDVIGTGSPSPAASSRSRAGATARRSMRGTYKSDPAKRPAQIDFDNTDAGPKGSWKGIVRLDGVTLKTSRQCPRHGEGPPDHVRRPPGSGHIFITFTREGPDTPEDPCPAPGAAQRAARSRGRSRARWRRGPRRARDRSRREAHRRVGPA